MLVEDVVRRCVKVLERDDIRNQIESTVRPVVGIILERLYPYVFVTMTLIIIIFGLLVFIFVSIVNIQKTLVMIQKVQERTV
jgi:hypothetical protein